MNCPNCGAVLPQGTQSCPACGTMLMGTQGFDGYAQGYDSGAYTSGFDPTAYNQRGYAQNYQPPTYGQSGYSQGYDTGAYGQAGYQQGFDTGSYPRQPPQQTFSNYPQGYQPAYGHYQAGTGERGAFVTTLGYLPRVVTGMFRNPGETLQGMIERNDMYTGSVVAGLALLLTFLAGMLMTGSAISMVLNGLSSLTGLALAGDTASMNQGISYIAGKIAAPLGGIAALCEVFSVVFPAAVALVYLCVLRKVRFSFVLLSNLVALVTLPSIAASILCMVASLISPFLGLMVLLLGEVVSYLLLITLMAFITGQQEQHSVPMKIAVICASEVLKLLFIQLIGGALLGATLQTVSALISTMGSLL